MELSGKRVLVMGLGVHGGGLGVARWLLRQGAQVTVTDVASPEALAAPVAALDAAAAARGVSVAYTLGAHRVEDFTSAEMVVVNPAVRPDSPWLAHAVAAGVPVETEMTLFFRVCPGPIFGVTGTKGKTTTALLLAAMLRERYPDTVAAGNLRVSALEALDTITAQTPVVLELSSFQLERLGAVGLSPRYSLITNLSSDHLNWHGSMENYAAAKGQIYRHQAPDGVVALNGADDGSAEYCTLWDAGRPLGGRQIWVGAGPHWSRVRSRYPQPVVRAVDTRVELHHDTVFWCDARGVFGPATPPQGEPLFVRGDLRLPGAHNLYNAMLAAALARAFGVEAEALRAGVRGFAGVEHRLEPVRELEAVYYVNDTTATNPAATLAALAAIETPLILIAGGADKQLDFRSLGAAIARRVKALVLLDGSATPRLLDAIAAGGVPPSETALVTISGPFSDFAQAIAAARALAGSGDTVLLSPGCASFGMFRNEFERGEQFRRLVGELDQR